jgi:hypothetical protein
MSKRKDRNPLRVRAEVHAGGRAPGQGWSVGDCEGYGAWDVEISA